MKTCKQVVILAGGKGSRLKSRMGDVPKPMVQVLGKPLLEHIIRLCVEQGFTDIQMLVHYRGEIIRDYFGDGKKFKVNITYHEEIHPRGTAGAVLDIVDKLADQFIVIYGDTYLNVSLKAMCDYHQKHKSDITLFLHPNDHPQDSDLIDLDKFNKIKEIHSYPHPDGIWIKNLVNAALYVVKNEAINNVIINDNHKPDFAKHLFPILLTKHKRMYGYVSSEYIKDMGTPERLDQVENDINSGKVKRLSKEVKKSALFFDRDGVLNKEVNYLSSPEELKVFPGVASAVRRVNQAGILTVVITNQPVVARGECSLNGLQSIHNKLETLLGQEGAYLDSIYYCPHHPDQGFQGEILDLKIDCDCRKPKPGLFKQASKELNISLNDSWMVGDATSDILAAKNSGIRNILVRTGFAGRDFKYDVIPDYTCATLNDAVSWVLDGYPDMVIKVQNYMDQLLNARLIVIGGLARSGKSFLAQVIREQLEHRKKQTHIICFDNWLLPENERAKTGNVINRFNFNSAVDFVRSLNKNSEITVPILQYDRKKKGYFTKPTIINIQKDDAIILEGVPALYKQDVFSKADISFYMECDENERKIRMEKDYSWRGLNGKQFNKLYMSRKVDEHDIIRGTKNNADFVLQI